MKQQKGFTLIELIVVIVILGILAATALPKFYDLSGEAKIAAIKGVAGGLSSGGSVNYAVRSLNANSGVATANALGVGLACSTFVGSLMEGGLPAGYTVGLSTAPNCTVDTTTATSAVAAYVPLIK